MTQRNFELTIAFTAGDDESAGMACSRLVDLAFDMARGPSKLITDVHAVSSRASLPEDEN